MKILNILGKIGVSLLVLPFAFIFGVLLGITLFPLYIIDCVWNS